MALDFNVIKVLLWAKNLGVSFDRTATLGRQGFDCAPRRFRRAARDFGIRATAEEIERCFQRAPFGPLYADQFLRLLGAREIVSVDLSDFEGATMLHDLNEPFPETECGRFNVVLDGGTLEHIFDYPAALRHCLELVGEGGHFITIAPAHNHMGHGFYQLSPELFFRVLNEQNGFALRKIVLYDSSKTDADFFQVDDPAKTGKRTELISDRPMLLAVIAQRIAVKPILARLPQQSDYAAAWVRRKAAAQLSPIAGGFLEGVRRRINPYLPYGLIHLKRKLIFSWKRGSPSLRNREHFRRLSRDEIINGRADS